MKELFCGEVLENKLIAPDVWDMRICASDTVKAAQAGQFVSLYTGDSAMLLPRPISICEIDRLAGVLRIVYRVVGGGTEKIAALKTGCQVQGLAPLGSHYQINPKHGKFAIVGGGMGTPPMLALASKIRGEVPNAHISVFLGFRDKSQVILDDDFTKYANGVTVSTDDGSFGVKGNPIQLLPDNPEFDAVFGCGPHIMLKYLAKYADGKGLPCHVSLEERMACSIGACLACVTKIGTTNDWQYSRVCASGPVFDAKEVVWE
ncbi:MAG: dihydroorotate dehydrogenase electron transfer subunit [Defluviitaleaceae bacterium]|nr:dihydroorotate dehydrogenase electron transfer subunit [Defluviitaleaceae bacterium]